MIVVTGATGNVGARLARLLAGGGDVRALSRDEQDDATLQELKIEPVRGDFDDPVSLERAFRGADRLLVLTPFAPDQERYEANAIDAAQAAGVGHVVKLAARSGLATGEIAAGRAHRASIDRLRASGLPLTVVSATAYASNLLSQIPLLTQGQIIFPGGQARMAWLHPQDLAEVLAALLTGAAQPGTELEVTGPESLSFSELAGQVSAGLGRDVTFVDVPPDAWRDSLLDAGVPQFFADALTELFQWQQRQGSDPVTETVETLTGHAGVSVERYVRDELAPAVEHGA